MTTPVAILTDTTLCVGCEDCVAACKRVNGLGADRSRNGNEAAADADAGLLALRGDIAHRWKASIDELSSSRFTRIVRRRSPDGLHNVRQFCRHCLEPACASVCPVGALKKTPEGPVTYDGDLCMGCRYCMTACPFGIPRYDWEKSVPYVRKCTMCYERLGEGKLPGCVEACSYHATIFGTREDLLAEAKRRLAANPEKYVQKVYGETEVGGTSVLYISDIPLDFLSWQPDLDSQPLPDRTWAALKKVPPIVLGMSGLMAGLYWITGRRMKLQEEARAGAAAAAAAAADVETEAAEEQEGQS